jgi:hypothetical protein
MDQQPNAIAYRTDHRLGDTFALQAFMMRNHLLRRGLLLAVLMLGGLVVTTVMNGAPLVDAATDLVRNIGFYLALFLVGLAVICLIAFLFGALAWRRRPRPREINATITGTGITLMKDGFSYGARWADANLVTQNASAYLLRFNQLYMRLPKRGFTPEQDVTFRALLRAALPPGANRLGS